MITQHDNARLQPGAEKTLKHQRNESYLENLITVKNPVCTAFHPVVGPEAFDASLPLDSHDSSAGNVLSGHPNEQHRPAGQPTLLNLSDAQDPVIGWHELGKHARQKRQEKTSSKKSSRGSFSSSMFLLLVFATTFASLLVGVLR